MFAAGECSTTARDNRVSDESNWIDRARAGDQEAFARLIEMYQTPIFNLAYRMLGDPAEAEDAAQEAFMRAYSRLASFDPCRSFKTWLFSIASHHCIDRLRKRRLTWLSLEEPVSADVAPALAEQSPGPEEQMVRGEQAALIQKHLGRLSPDDRLVVVMRYWYDFSYEEIAEATGGTVSAVKSRLHRARLALAEKLADERDKNGKRAPRLAEALP
jgi:RNA polymerase sigma-70 factor (ECF subfamily)